MTIDRSQLRQLAFDPQVSTRAAFEKLGFNNYATFDYQLKKDPEALQIWKEGRDAAAGASSASTTTSNGDKPARRQTPKPPPRKAAKRAKPSRVPPPRNANANGAVNKELLRKLILEFNHIDVYGRVSEHFNDLKEELDRCQL